VKVGLNRLITLSDPLSPGAEAFRTLRANIQLCHLASPMRSLLVTGAGAEEESAMVLCNLAVTIAQAGSRVVLADADFRQPSLHEILELGNDKGLATLLLGQDEGELPLQETAVPGLRAITSGPVPPNLAHLAGSPRIRDLVDRLADTADVVMFNAPPIGVVADAALLAGKVDGVVLVVSAGRTRRETAFRAKTALEKANARILGVVVDNARPDPSLYRYFKSLRKG